MTETVELKLTDGDTSQEIFETGEKVLCLFQGLPYEAKIASRKMRGTKLQYKIHYHGWNKRWDEWVEGNRLVLHNENNLNYMNQAQAAAKAKEKERELQEVNDNSEPPSPSTSPQPEQPSATVKTTRKRRSTSKSKNAPKKRRLNREQNTNLLLDDESLEIELPTEMKKKLINDWESITHSKKLLTLPRPQSAWVSTILDEFVDESVKNSGNLVRPILNEVSRGLREYFDQALSVLLLYKFERPQQQQLQSINPGKPMSQIYGAEHLCRLFVKLPQLLTNSNLDKQGREILRDKIQELIQFILRNSGKYFTDSYDNPPQDYQLMVSNSEDSVSSSS